MAKTDNTAASAAVGGNTVPAPEVAAQPATQETGMHEVRLSRPVELYGHVYLPCYRHVVNDAALKALGDAVVDAKQV